MSTSVQQLGQKQRHPDRKLGEKEREGVLFGYILLPAEPLKKIFSEQKQINSGFWLSLYTDTTHLKKKTQHLFPFIFSGPNATYTHRNIWGGGKQKQS